MGNLLLKGDDSKEGVSSFQVFALAISVLINSGNFTGIATTNALVSMGTIFWMWATLLLDWLSPFLNHGCKIWTLFCEKKIKKGCKTKKGLYICIRNARVAQLVELQPSKLTVAGSSPVSRSKKTLDFFGGV